MLKKLSVLLSVFAVGLLLVACGGNSEMDTYLDENRETLEGIFGNIGLGDDFTIAASGDDELVVTFEITESSYESMTQTTENLGFDTIGDTFEAFINDTSADSLAALPNAIVNETELDSATVVFTINFDGDELTTMRFESQ